MNARFMPSLGRFWVACSLLVCAVSHAASPEWESPPISHKDVQPYFDARALYALVLPPPPEPGSATDRDDIAALQARQQASAERREQARADSQWLYDRFAPALGVTALRRDGHPAIVQLLNRSLKQVGGPAFAAKAAHPRARPYQRMQAIYVCGNPDPDGTRRTSYPSGHAAYGWTVALVLARVMPERAPALLTRATEYADSRLVCGMHFPSDIEAARQLATAVVTQLDSHADFQRDIERARAELASPR
ncbi:phosphatase PAP2 family protein [Roseateles asaccharophilus]|uniref:Acid phosphatase n=1 Tax=Roseateles asaccharophilus TaxID=582607 RepID=A0ABU2ACD4_9BURK|nr:phosphatase PAP2 family protein [Roseateles asaccharophilus]MDR7334861.1 acid phosphatase (class A) [Roseateles asaccharophilus]